MVPVIRKECSGLGHGRDGSGAPSENGSPGLPAGTQEGRALSDNGKDGANGISCCPGCCHGCCSRHAPKAVWPGGGIRTHKGQEKGGA